MQNLLGNLNEIVTKIRLLVVISVCLSVCKYELNSRVRFVVLMVLFLGDSCPLRCDTVP